MNSSKENPHTVFISDMKDMIFFPFRGFHVKFNFFTMKNKLLQKQVPLIISCIETTRINGKYGKNVLKN